MKTVKMILIGLILFFMMLGTTVKAYAILYDDFSGTFIDKTKWKWGEWVTEISGGKLLLKHGSHNPNTASSFPYTTWNNLPFSNANSVNSIQADVTILQNQITGTGFTRARLEGRWFNDGTPGGGMTGDVYAEISLISGPTPTGLFARWAVSKSTNAAGPPDTIIEIGNFDTTITLGTTYTLYIEYNSSTHQFIFRVGSEEKTFGPDGLPARIGNANSPGKSLTTRVQIDNPNSSAYIVATFDDVYKNGALYDDFPSPVIDSAKWYYYEFAREISSGKLRSKLRSSTAYTSPVTSSMELTSPMLIKKLQAKITLLDYQNPQGLYQRAHVGGAFYNDGTGSPGTGRVGDIGAQVRIGGWGSYPIAEWFVFRFADPAGEVIQGLARGTFNTPITLGTPYTLSVEWDWNRFIMRFENEVAYYTPTTSLIPPYVPRREISTRIVPEPDKKEASIEALFDDVEVNLLPKNLIDFDGDGKTDIAVYRTGTGAWYVYPSGGGAPYGFGWGGDASDKPAPGDYDGDGKTDIAVYREGTGAWYVYPSGGGAPYGLGWGGDATDKPAPGDYDGDVKTDIAVYRSGTGAWYVYPSGGGAPYGFGWGGDTTDKPAPGDYDGDGKTDIAVYRSETGAWYVYPSGGGAPYGFGWGGDASDKPAPGDYDGDGKTDIAVYRGATGAWYVIPSGGGAPYGLGWGGDISDKPAPGDYDGDGKTDCAVYRTTTGAWYVYPSGGGAPYGLGWGGDATDKPVTLNLSSLE